MAYSSDTVLVLGDITQVIVTKAVKDINNVRPVIQLGIPQLDKKK